MSEKINAAGQEPTSIIGQGEPSRPAPAAPFLDRVREIAVVNSRKYLDGYGSVRENVESAILQAIREYSALPVRLKDFLDAGDSNPNAPVKDWLRDCESAKLKHYLGE